MLGHDLDLVEPRSEVHLGEDARTSHGIQALVYARNGVHDFLGEGVEAPVVDAEVETSIVLFREKKRRHQMGSGLARSSRCACTRPTGT